jgi:D-lyxose ketol-isomerase
LEANGLNMEEYKATLEAYTQMVTQMKLNRGGDPMVLRLLRMKLERLVKEIKAQEPVPVREQAQEQARGQEQELARGQVPGQEQARGQVQ